MATVVVGGKVLVEDRRFTELDVEALFREVRAFCDRGLPAEHRERAEMLGRVKPYAQAWYKGWADEVMGEPFYRFNSRV